LRGDEQAVREGASILALGGPEGGRGSSDMWREATSEKLLEADSETRVMRRV
jgi:hypothetical protein